MEFSDHWRAPWCIGSVFPAPQLITGSSAGALGPLLFDRAGDSLSLLNTGCKLDPFAQTSLSLNNQMHAFQEEFWESFVPYDVLDSCVREDASEQLSMCLNSNQILGNRLQGLKCRDGTVQLFFPSGANMDKIGSVICSDGGNGSWKICKPLHCDHTMNLLERDNFPISPSVHHPIVQLAAIGRDPLICDEFIEGFLLARSSYAVNWLRAETKEGFSTLHHLATANFKKYVSHVCWNPHLPEESAVILETGELRLFDISSCRETSNSVMKLTGKSLLSKQAQVTCGGNNVCKERVADKKFRKGFSELDFQSKRGMKESWWRCEYSWHPRTLLVAGRAEICLVDFRARKDQFSAYSTILAKASSPEMHSYCSCPSQKDYFVAFARADYDMFQFSVATRQHVLLYDSRQPLTPILQWEHGLKQFPGYLQMCKLSDLRPSAGNKFKWASDSGHAILAASFRSGDMRVFCYGPQPSVDPNIDGARKQKLDFSEDLDFPDVLYAWQLPSKICAANGNYCENNINDPSIQDDSHIDFLYPKLGKSCLNVELENMCGLCIISDQPSLRTSGVSSEESDQDTVSGFSLMQVTGTGKLLSQRYQASTNLIEKTLRGRHDSSAFVTSSSYANLDIPKHLAYIYKKVPVFLRFLKTGSILHGIIQSSFARNQKICKPNGKDSLMSSDTRKSATGCAVLDELIGGAREASRFKQVGSLPVINNALHQITGLHSIYEISCNSLWMGLPVNVLQLAFVTCADLYSVRRVKQSPPNFLQIFPPNSIQLSLFELSNSHRKTESQSTYSEDQIVLGPILPLPFLLELQHRQETHAISSKMSSMLGREKIQNQCQYIMDAVENSKHDDLGPQFDDFATVSLADDNDMWIRQRDSEQENSFLLHKPSVDPLEGKEQISPENGSFLDASEEEDPSLKKKRLSLFWCNGIHDNSEHGNFIGAKHHGSSSKNAERWVMSELDYLVCPINFSYFGPETDLEAEELEMLKNFKQQFHRWQKGFKPYQSYLANVYRTL